MNRRNIRLALILIFISFAMDSQFSKLPDFYVELADGNKKSICSGTLLSATDILSATHCGNPRFAKSVDGEFHNIVRLYSSYESDVSFWSIQGDGYELEQYPTIGFGFWFLPSKAHSHANHIKERIYFWDIGEWFLHDLESPIDSKIRTDVRVQVPLVTKGMKGHSGSAMIQNHRIITGMLIASDIDHHSSGFTYSVSGLKLYKHWIKYQEIVKLINEAQPLSPADGYYGSPTYP